MSDGQIKVESLGAIWSIQISRPGKKNALTQPMYREMEAALKEGDGRDDVHVILLRGDAGAYCAGSDIVDFIDAANTEKRDRAAIPFLQTLNQVKKPVVAAVNGMAIGIGTTMLLHCDLVIAGDDAFFATTFAKLGVCPEGGSSVLLPRLLGYQRAAEMLMLGERISAQRMYEMGLVNQVVPAAECHQIALQKAEQLAALPLSSLLTTKKLLKEGQQALVHDTITRESDHFSEHLFTDATKAILQGMVRPK